MISALLIAACLATSTVADDRPCVAVVVGAPGTPEYESEFRRWAELWKATADRGKADFIAIGTDAETSPPDRDRLEALIQERSSPSAGNAPLWIVLIGHGTFDGREAKFNLRGPDLTDVELAKSLEPVKRPLAVINCASASGSFLGKLSREGRIVITATRSGDEQNFARFGQFLAESIADPAADLDKDEQVSLLEAFIVASNRTAEFYRTQSRLASEHSLIDDNGDRLGTPSDWFRGTRAVKRAKNDAQPDGARAHQLSLVLNDREQRMSPESRQRRDEIERSIAALRARKEKMAEDDYYAQLEPLMLDLARLYRDALPPQEETPKAP